MNQMNQKNKTAFITGVTGQDGSYLAELLLGKGYRVVGMARRVSNGNAARLRLSLRNPNFKLVQGDLTDAWSVSELIRAAQPDEVYNLGALSQVGSSFHQPHACFDATGVGVLNILEAVRRFAPQARFYQASSSEMFGNSFTSIYDSKQSLHGVTKFQNEDTPFRPTSPYAIAKYAGHQLVDTYRRAYGMFAVAGILFNHSSERRGVDFVTRKITRYLGKLCGWYADKKNPLDAPKLNLGNLDSYRDEGYAPDYVEAMYLMLQQPAPKDYVIATGETHSVREFLNMTFSLAGFSVSDHVVIDPALFRPSELDYLRGDSSRAQHDLKWTPKTSYETIAKNMLEEDMFDETNRFDND